MSLLHMVICICGMPTSFLTKPPCRFLDGRIIVIDVGISPFYGGNCEALELLYDKENGERVVNVLSKFLSS